MEVAACGLPAGIGSPCSTVSKTSWPRCFFGIPAVKALEFGDGFGLRACGAARPTTPIPTMRAAKWSPPAITTAACWGGITNGMPLIARLTVKPTSSISQPQQTVDLVTGRPATLQVKGRHDPCIVPRAVPVAEAMLAYGLLDRLVSEGRLDG